MKAIEGIVSIVPLIYTARMGTAGSLERRHDEERKLTLLREERREFWEQHWSCDDFSPPWAHRGALREIIEAVKTGWLPACGPVLDIGCGTGLATAWFAEHGYEALGIDIAQGAIRRARKLHAPMHGLEFMILDASAQPPPDRQFKILIDQGCLHQIPSPLAKAFANNISSVAAPDARMLLFHKAFREGAPFGDEAETQVHVQQVRELYGETFLIERYAPTDLARDPGSGPDTALPGLVFWLVGRGA